jgi:hypothetical protein
MNEREQASTPKEKTDTENQERTIPTFLPPAREGGNEDVLRLMRAL